MPSEVVLLDTSVLCELVRVPGHYKPERHEAVVRELSERHRRGDQLLLPIGAILETGNHISQAADGTLRRRAAKNLATFVNRALAGKLPFQPMNAVDSSTVRRLMSTFVDDVTVGFGPVDRTILIERDRLQDKARDATIIVWTADTTLASHNPGPP